MVLSSLSLSSSNTTLAHAKMKALEMWGSVNICKCCAVNNCGDLDSKGSIPLVHEYSYVTFTEMQHFTLAMFLDR